MGIDRQKKSITSDRKKSYRVQQLRFDYWKEIEGIALRKKVRTLLKHSRIYPSLFLA